jgi:tRNA threonylcarbamoyladenosine biosynthesis protein TsaB
VITLAIDASTPQGSVACIDHGRVIAERTVAMRGADEERLAPAVAEVLQTVGWPVVPIARIVCGEGPGSFTSLRIAGALAKGLAESSGVPLLAASSLALIVAGVDGLAPGPYLAALDAMRGESWVARIMVASGGEIVAVGGVERVPTSEVSGLAQDATVVGPGHGASAAPHARGVVRLLETPWLRQVDLDRWEPQYGRLAEAQVKWELAHGRPLDGAGT